MSDWVRIENGTLDIGVITLMSRRQRWAYRLFPWVRRRADAKRERMAAQFFESYEDAVKD